MSTGTRRFRGRDDTGGGNRWEDKDPFEWAKENDIALTDAQAQAIRETQQVLKETPRDPGIPNGHILVGPIAVEDAMPGDTLEVRILSVTARIPYGTVGMRPGRGAIPDDFHVTQVVDETKGVHAMIPKRLFTGGTPPYRYKPTRHPT